VNRWRDWWDQAHRDLGHAEHSVAAADFEWAAFAAQQAAEKALKALIMAHGGDPFGHSVTSLAEAAPAGLEASPAEIEAANRLDKHYIPSRYPNGFARLIDRHGWISLGTSIRGTEQAEPGARRGSVRVAA